MKPANDWRIIELVLSESFRSRVFGEEDNGSWKKYVDQDPGKYKEVIDQAALLVRTIRFNADRMEEGQSLLLKQRIRRSLISPAFPQAIYLARRKLLQYAAALLILLTGIWIGYQFKNKPAFQEKETLTWKTFVAPNGRIKNLVLPDGTPVTLNAGSTLDYPVPFTDRYVKLEGEAYFEVKPDKHHPFRVQTRDVETTVLGTSFNVNTRDGKIQVALVEGKVGVENRTLNKSLVLKPGKMAIAGEGSMEIRDFDLREVLGWKDHILVYRSKSLGFIFRDLERIHGVKITLNKNVDQTKKYTGRFEREPLDSILKGIGYVSGFSSRRNEKEIVIF